MTVELNEKIFVDNLIGRRMFSSEKVTILYLIQHFSQDDLLHHDGVESISTNNYIIWLGGTKRHSSSAVHGIC